MCSVPWPVADNPLDSAPTTTTSWGCGTLGTNGCNHVDPTDQNWSWRVIHDPLRASRSEAAGHRGRSSRRGSSQPISGRWRSGFRAAAATRKRPTSASRCRAGSGLRGGGPGCNRQADALRYERIRARRFDSAANAWKIGDYVDRIPDILPNPPTADTWVLCDGAASPLAAQRSRKRKAVRRSRGTKPWPHLASK